MKPKLPKLPSAITVRVNGSVKEVFMSFNKLNRCNFILGDIENIPHIMISPSVREAMICEMLKEKDTEAKLEDFDINADDAQRLLDFVSQHLLDFMLGVLEKAAALQEMNKDRADAIAAKVSGLTPTKNGLEDSLSYKAAV